MWQGAANCVDTVQQICCVSQVSGSCIKFCMIIKFYFLSFALIRLSSLVDTCFVFLFTAIFYTECVGNV